jgi:plasmid maintenance system antidote protein VapI
MARAPIHPGEHLAEELKDLKISAAELARQIDVAVKSSHWCIDERDQASRA